MTTQERVELKRKAMRYDTIVTWFVVGVVMVGVLLLCGCIDGPVGR